MLNKNYLGKAITVFFSTITVNMLLRNFSRFVLAESLKENDISIINFLKRGELHFHGTPNDIKVKDNYAFIATQKNGLQIIDISDPVNPTLVGRYNTTYHINGFVYPINDIAFKDDLIFLADDMGGLRIIDAQNVSNPTTVSVYFTGWPVAQIAIVGDRACLADGSDMLNLALVDISEPKRIWRNGVMNLYSINLQGNNPQHFYIHNNIAYIANVGSDILQIVNISDINYPETLSFFRTTGLMDVSIDQTRTIAYIIADFIYEDRSGFLQIVNISDLTQPQYIDEYTFSIEKPRRIIVDKHTAYIVHNAGLKIINVTLPSNPQTLGQYSANITCACNNDKSYNVTWTGLAKQAHHIYMLDCAGLIIVDVSDATAPQRIGTFSSSNYGSGRYYCPNGQDIVIQDKILYLVMSVSTPYYRIDELQLINVSNPVFPQLSGNYSSVKYVYSKKPHSVGIHVSNQKVYMATGTDLDIIDVHKFTQLKLLNSYSLPGFAKSVKVIGDVAYVACDGLNGGSGEGLFMIDTSFFELGQPLGKLSYQTGSQITQLLSDSTGIFILYAALGLNWLEVGRNNVDTYYLSYRQTAIKVNNEVDKAYLVTSGGKFQILDISNTAAVKQFANYSVEHNARDLTLIQGTNDVVYIAADDKFQVLDVSNPLQIKMTYEQKSRGYGFICISDDVAYLATNTWSAIIDTFDIEDPKKPKHLGTYRYGSYSTNALKDFTIINNIGYLVGVGPVRSNGLQIVNYNNPAKPLPITYYPTDAQSIDFYDNNIYALSGSEKNTVIDVVNVRNPSRPLSVGKFDFFLDQINHPSKIRIREGVAYITSPEGLVLFSLLDPTYPQVIGIYRSGSNMPLVEFMGENNIVVTDERFGLHFITKASFSDSRFQMQTLPLKMAFSNRTAYVVDHLKTLYTINIENRLNLTKLSDKYQFISDVQSLIVKNDILYAAVGKDGVEVIDIYDPASPKRVSFLQDEIQNAKLLCFANKKLLVLDAKKGLIIYDIIGQPLIVNHQFSMTPGEGIVVTPLQLSVRDTTVDANIMALRFLITHMQHGRFEWITHPGIALTNFTQQAIHAGKIKLVSTEPDTLPSFRIHVSNGISITASIDAIIHPNGDIPPRIVNNRLVINEGESVVITNQYLNGFDLTVPSSKLRFITNDIINGRFEQISKPGMTITNFLGQNVSSDQIRFVHTGSGFDKPSYKVTVSNGQLESLLSNATISFNAAPKLIKNQLFITRGATVVLTNENLQAIDIDDDNATLLFTISQIEHGAFNQVNFTQGVLAQGQITFTHDDTDQPPIYWVNVSDRHMNVGPQKAVTSLTVPINSTAIAIGATVGGVALGTLIALVIWYRRRAVEANTRKHNPFADYVRDALKLKDVDDFNSQKGKYYVSVMQKLHDEFAQQGNSLEERDDRELRDIAKMVAEAARNKITTSSTLFGYSLITTAEIESKIKYIVQEVVRRRVGVLDEEPGVDLENLAADAEYSADQNAII